MIRVLSMDLAYGLKKEQRIEPQTGRTTPNRELTRTLIVGAFQSNYQQGMDKETSRFYRSIVLTLDKAVDDEKDFVEISEADLDKIREEVFKTKYDPMRAFIAPILYDELDAIKGRDVEVDVKLREEHLYPALADMNVAKGLIAASAPTAVPSHPSHPSHLDPVAKPNPILDANNK